MIFKLEGKKHPGRYNLPSKGLKRLAVVNGYQYHYLADADVPSDCTAPVATPEEIAAIKKLSHACAIENDATQRRIREKYSIEEELRCLRLGKGSPEFKEYNRYIEECIKDGKARKAKFGL